MMTIYQLMDILNPYPRLALVYLIVTAVGLLFTEFTGPRLVIEELRNREIIGTDTHGKNHNHNRNSSFHLIRFYRRFQGEL
ncbi:hypothetical protein DP804_19820 [Salmonella enterica subsp. enterica]|nr:hypothetical protein [Salmonella enterica subsp. enterica serovar Virchow]